MRSGTHVQVSGSRVIVAMQTRSQIGTQVHVIGSSLIVAIQKRSQATAGVQVHVVEFQTVLGAQLAIYGHSHWQLTTL